MELWLSIRQFIAAEWPLLVPVVLGFLAVYWLLPQARRHWVVPGSVAGALALGLGGWLLVQHYFATVEGVLFYIFSAIAIVGAGLMLAQHNPVRSALSFALVVLSTCGLFLLLGAPFLMAATVIIYAGAIIITFLFVIMLAQQVGMTNADQRSREPFLSSLAGFVLLGSLLVVLHRNYDMRNLKIDERYAPVLEKLNAAANAKTVAEIKAVLENPNKQKDDESPLELVEDLNKLLPKEYHPEVNNIDEYLHFGKLDELRRWCEKFAKILNEQYQQVRQEAGSLRPSGKLPLSPFSGVSANVPFSSHTKELLPARNVEALGQSLFSDYLVAVEIAGLLLLVATIGAIIIAGRNPHPYPSLAGRGIGGEGVGNKAEEVRR